MAATLKRLTKSGEFANEVLFLHQQKSYCFGRRSNNDVVLFAPTVSKQHCIFHHNLNGLFVEVLKSLAGVVVNGKKYSTGSMVRLRNNDLVEIGLLFNYRVEMKPFPNENENEVLFTSDFETDFESMKEEDTECEDASGVEDTDYEETRRETLDSDSSGDIKLELEEIVEPEITREAIHSAMEISFDEEEQKPLVAIDATKDSENTPKIIEQISINENSNKLKNLNSSPKRKRLKRKRKLSISNNENSSKIDDLDNEISQEKEIVDKNTQNGKIPNLEEIAKKENSEMEILENISKKGENLESGNLESEISTEREITNDVRMFKEKIVENLEKMENLENLEKIVGNKIGQNKSNKENSFYTNNEVNSLDKESFQPVINLEIYKSPKERNEKTKKNNEIFPTRKKRFRKKKKDVQQKIIKWVRNPFAQNNSMENNHFREVKIVLERLVIDTQNKLENKIPSGENLEIAEENKIPPGEKLEIAEEKKNPPGEKLKIAKARKNLEIVKKLEKREIKKQKLENEMKIGEICDLEKLPEEREIKKSFVSLVDVMKRENSEFRKMTKESRESRGEHFLLEEFASSSLDTFLSDPIPFDLPLRGEKKFPSVKLTKLPKEFFHSLTPRRKRNSKNLLTEYFPLLPAGKNSSLSQKINETDFQNETEFGNETDFQNETKFENKTDFQNETEFKNETKRKSKNEIKEKGKLERNYKCPKCPKLLFSGWSLKRHLTTHEKKLFICKICGKGVGRHDYLKIHEKLHKTDRPYSCEKCGLGFVTKNGLKRHVVTHNEERKFTCDICQHKFKTRMTLVMHMRIHLGVTKKTCSICQKVLANKKSYIWHMSTHTLIKNIPCKLCSKLFYRQGDLENHLLTHENRREYKCHYCGKGFNFKTVLDRHMRSMHTREGLIQCNICDKAFIVRTEFETHMRSHTGERPFTCEECGKNYRSKRQLISHLKSHLPKFTCNECNETFVNKFQLLHHMKIHFPKEQLLCSYCQKEFKKLSLLKNHLRVHTNERPFHCHICDKRYKLKCDLRVHMFMHTDTYPYPCNRCEKGYERKHLLINHYRMHLGEKPFICKICHFTFRYRASLNKHYHKHKRNVRKCEICELDFRGKVTFEKHCEEHKKLGGKFNCTVCKRKFKVQKDLIEHCQQTIDKFGDCLEK